MKDLTKLEWAEIKTALSHIPARKRTEAVKKTAEFVDAVLDGLINVAVPITPNEFRYAVNCSLCKKPIRLDQDFAYRSNENVHNHLDCWFQEKEPDAPSSGT